MAKNYGAKKVLVSGTDQDIKVRLPKALELGADYVVNVDRVNIKEYVDDVTDGRGVDLAVECAGSQHAMNDAIEILRRNGKICTMGMPGERNIEIPWKKAVFKSLDLIFSYSSSASSWSMVQSMLQRGVISTKPLITHRETMENYMNIFQEASSGDVIKAILFHKG